jgi:hypothetical protein
MSLLPQEAGARRPNFLSNGTVAAAIDLCARAGLQKLGQRRSSATRRVKHPAFVNSNLVEARAKHPHLQSIMAVAFAFCGNAGV